MKKSTKLLVVLALAATTAVGAFALTSCGSAKTTGIYENQHIANLTDGDNTSTLYKLKTYSDNTYELNFNYTFAIANMGVNYGRNITSYGKFTVTSSDKDTGEQTLSLAMPTVVEMVATHRNGTKIVINSANWSTTDADGDGKVDPVEYVLMERASTETWDNAADFLASYGKAYTAKVTTAGYMEITVIGEQIALTDAVANVNAAE